MTGLTPRDVFRLKRGIRASLVEWQISELQHKEKVIGRSLGKFDEADNDRQIKRLAAIQEEIKRLRGWVNRIWGRAENE